MPRLSTLALSALLTIALIGTPAHAQHESVVSITDIDDALAEHGRNIAGDRARARAFLTQPAVTGVMQHMGLDASRLRASIALLDDAEAQAFADRLDAVSREQAGGDVLVISSTTIIIGLLILLVVLVAD